MKKILLIIALISISTIGFSQNNEARTQNNLNLGVGFSGWGVPVYIGLDFGIARDFTLGLEFSYRNYRENWRNDYYHHSIMGFSGNANYHFNRILQIPSNWDFYAGLNLGFFVWSSPDSYHGNHSSGLGLGGQVGVRYFLSNRIGLNLEFGGGNAFSGGKFGLTFKI